MNKIIKSAILVVLLLATGCASTGTHTTALSEGQPEDKCEVNFLTPIFVDKAPDCYYREILEDIKRPFGEHVMHVELPEIVVLNNKTFEDVYGLLCDLKGCESALAPDEVAAFHYRGYVFFRVKNAWGYEIIAHELAHFMSWGWKSAWMEGAVMGMAEDFAFYSRHEAQEAVEHMRDAEDAEMLLRENFASGMGRFYAWMEDDSNASIFDTP